MKKCFIVYYADKSANVVISSSVPDVLATVPTGKINDIVKIDYIPFEVL